MSFQLLLICFFVACQLAVFIQLQWEKWIIQRCETESLLIWDSQYRKQTWGHYFWIVWFWIFTLTKMKFKNWVSACSSKLCVQLEDLFWIGYLFTHSGENHEKSKNIFSFIHWRTSKGASSSRRLFQLSQLAVSRQRNLLPSNQVWKFLRFRWQEQSTTLCLWSSNSGEWHLPLYLF